VHDHLLYSGMQFFPRLAAFNLSWHELPKRGIYSYVPPRLGWLTRPGTPDAAGDHSAEYAGWLESLRKQI
jgi:hypothetical protein